MLEAKLCDAMLIISSFEVSSFSKKSIVKQQWLILINLVGFVFILKLISGFIFFHWGLQHWNLRIVTSNLLFMMCFENERLCRICRVHSHATEKNIFLAILSLFIFYEKNVILLKQRLILICWEKYSYYFKKIKKMHCVLPFRVILKWLKLP